MARIARPRDFSTLFLLVLLGVSLTLNVVLGLRLRTMPTALENRGFREGMPIGVVPVVDPSGTEHSLRFENETAAVLYILSPTCLWCARNEAAVKALAEAIRHQYRFVGLSNTDEGFREYASATSLPFSIYAVDATSLRETADLTLLEALGSTPQTIVINGGRITRG